VTLPDRTVEDAGARLTRLGFLPFGWADPATTARFVGGVCIGRCCWAVLGYGDPYGRTAVHVRVTTGSPGFADEGGLLAAACERLAARTAPRGQAGRVRAALLASEPGGGTLRAGGSALVASVLATWAGSIARVDHEGVDVVVETYGIRLDALALERVADLTPYLAR
jgi:hypothetical protein